MNNKFMKREREFVLSVYVGLFVLAMLIAIVLLLAFLLREFGFPQIHWLLVAGLPWLLLRILTDPAILLAIVVVAILVWALPWEDLLDGLQGRSNVQRGRSILGDRASRDYREAIRRHAEQRRKQKE